LKPASFSDQLEDQLAGDSLGQDFLTWLWFHSEVRGGMTSTDRGRFAAAIDGPLTFVLEGDGAHVMQLRKGSPLVSAEAKTALESGKKLSQAKVLMARGDDAWQFTLGAGDFTFRSTKVPKGEGLDPVSRFQERMMALDTMLVAFHSFFGEFLAQRFDPERWAVTLADMRRWVAERMTRM
jgi:recombination associated protein RdgC